MAEAELHLAYVAGNASIQLFPYPHFFVRNVFPADFYRTMLSMLPEQHVLTPIEQARGVQSDGKRLVLDFASQQLDALPAPSRSFWQELHGWLVGRRFAQLMINKFGAFIEERFNAAATEPELYDEALLVQDATDYNLGPHTDAPRKVLTFLFYLATDESRSHLGTSIYIPRDPGFRCAGGPHYDAGRFERIWTMPFVPNSLFAFFKNDVSFHGVEPVTDPHCRRWLLLYDVYARTSGVKAPPLSFTF